MVLRFLLRAWTGSLGSQSEYRSNYVFVLAGVLLNTAMSISTVLIVYRGGIGFPGWSLDESLLVLGLFSITTGILSTFLWPNLGAMAQHVALGTLDFVLLKPIDSQLQVSFSTLSLWSGTDILVGLVMVVYACVKIHAAVGNVLLAFIPLAFGLMIIYSIWFAVAATAIWFVRIDNASHILTAIVDAGRYPTSGYPPAYRIFLTYVLPVTFLTTVPAQVLIGRADGAHLIGGAITAAASLVLSRLLWKRALRSYTGASG